MQIESATVEILGRRVTVRAGDRLGEVTVDVAGKGDETMVVQSSVDAMSLATSTFQRIGSDKLDGIGTLASLVCHAAPVNRGRKTTLARMETIESAVRCELVEYMAQADRDGCYLDDDRVFEYGADSQMALGEALEYALKTLAGEL